MDGYIVELGPRESSESGSVNLDGGVGVWKLMKDRGCPGSLVVFALSGGSRCMHRVNLDCECYYT